jgi:hypothetical protein
MIEPIPFMRSKHELHFFERPAIAALLMAGEKSQSAWGKEHRVRNRRTVMRKDIIRLALTHGLPCDGTACPANRTNSSAARSLRSAASRQTMICGSTMNSESRVVRRALERGLFV